MHKIRLKFIISFFVLLSQIANSQILDTFFLEIPNEHRHSSNVRIIDGHFGVFIYQYNTEQLLLGPEVVSLLEIDKKTGEVLNIIEDLRIIDEDCTGVLNLLKFEEGYYLLLACTSAQNIFSLKTFSISKNLTEWQFIDQVEVGEHKDFFINTDFKQFNDGYEVIGRISSNGDLVENGHLKVNSNHKIEKFEIFPLSDPFQLVTDFERIEENLYLLSSWASSLQLMDENYQILDELNLVLDTLYNNVSIISTLTPYTCQTFGNKIICSCNGPKGDFALTFAVIEIENKRFIGSRFISGVKNTLDPEFDLQTHFSFQANDELVIAGSGLGEETNNGKLLITKLNQNSDIDWTMFFDDGKNYTYRDHVIDNNGDVFVCGAFLTEEQLYRNFVLKIFNNGSLISSNIDVLKSEEHFLVYPNPFSGELNITSRSSREEEFEVKIFSADLKLVHQSPLSGKSSLNLSHLPNGIYFFLIEKDKKFFNGKLIKN